MSQSIYTYGDILIAPYKFEKILSLKIVKELNEHTKLFINGIVPEEIIDEYVENEDENAAIEVQVKDGEEDTIKLFKGSVTKLSVEATGNVRTITIEALSNTFLMDITKNSRSFQNANTLYSEIFNELTGEYPNSEVNDMVTQNSCIGGLFVQYKETDWEFIKRLASHFNAPLIPAPEYDGLKYYIGIPELDKKCTFEEYNYTIKKDLKGYKEKSENDIEDLSEQNLISYEISSSKLAVLGSLVEFKDRNLYVYRAETNLENGILMTKYTLRDDRGLSRRTIYNNPIIGASLFGHIKAVAKDTVKVQLEIDESKSDGDLMWFPYSTVYSSPDGSGWYCMPEVGDRVRVCFPDEEEKNAFAASSVNMNSSNPSMRSDPSVKSISTKYGKQILFQPGAIEIINNKNLLMRITDDGGIEINSNKKITLSAQDDIEINGGSKIIMQGEDGIDLKQAGTSLSIKDNVTMTGGRVNIE